MTKTIIQEIKKFFLHIRESFNMRKGSKALYEIIGNVVNNF